MICHSDTTFSKCVSVSRSPGTFRFGTTRSEAISNKAASLRLASPVASKHRRETGGALSSDRQSIYPLPKKTKHFLEDTLILNPSFPLRRCKSGNLQEGVNRSLLLFYRSLSKIALDTGIENRDSPGGASWTYPEHGGFFPHYPE